MQTKLFNDVEQITLVPNTVNTLTIDNNEERKANFHNVHISGSIIGDHADADNFARGWICLFCIEQTQFAVPATMTSTVLENMQGQVILAKPWITFSGVTYNGAADVFRWDIALGKTSRSCQKGGRLIVKVYSDASSVKDIILQQHIDTNITQA